MGGLRLGSAPDSEGLSDCDGPSDAEPGAHIEKVFDLPKPKEAQGAAARPLCARETTLHVVPARALFGAEHRRSVDGLAVRLRRNETWSFVASLRNETRSFAASFRLVFSCGDSHGHDMQCRLIFSAGKDHAKDRVSLRLYAMKRGLSPGLFLRGQLVARPPGSDRGCRNRPCAGRRGRRAGATGSRAGLG